MLILNTSKLVEIFVTCDDFVKNLEKSPTYAEDFGFLASDGIMRQLYGRYCVLGFQKLLNMSDLTV